MKTAISVPDATFARVDEAARRLGISRSAFFAAAADRWLHELDDAATTADIDAVLVTAEANDEREFLARAAHELAGAGAGAATDTTVAVAAAVRRDTNADRDARADDDVDPDEVPADRDASW